MRSKRKHIFLLLTIFSLGAAFVVLINSLPNKIALGVARMDGTGEIIIYSRDSRKMTKFLIPGKTLLAVARNRGDLRMESLLPLIESEGLPLATFTDSLIKTMHVPIDVWVVERGETSLGATQKFALSLFELTVLPKDKVVIDLAETEFLEKVVLADGEEGFVKRSELPLQLKQLFVDSTSGPLKAGVNVAGPARGSMEDVLPVLELLGLQVVSIEDLRDGVVDCLIKAGSQGEVVKRLSRVFACDFEKKFVGNLDLVLVLGEEFAKRF